MKRDNIACSKYDNHFRLNLIVNITLGEGGDDLYDHLMSTPIFTLIMNKISVCTP